MDMITSQVYQVTKAEVNFIMAFLSNRKFVSEHWKDQGWYFVSTSSLRHIWLVQAGQRWKVKCQIKQGCL